MKRKNPSPKNESRNQPFVAAVILPILMLTAFSPTLLFQDVFPGDPVIPIENVPVETPQEKEARMLSAFENPNAVAGQIIVSFELGTTLEQANSILAAQNLRIETTQNCVSPQEAGPGETTVNGTPTCFTEGWFESIAAGLVLVSSGSEKTVASDLLKLEGVVWVEPNYTSTITDGGTLPVPTLYDDVGAPVPTLYENGPVNTSSNTLGIEPIWLVVGVLALGFGAFFAMKK